MAASAMPDRGRPARGVAARSRREPRVRLACCACAAAFGRLGAHGVLARAALAARERVEAERQRALGAGALVDRHQSRSRRAARCVASR
jgi:hypothetical protein